MTSAPETLRDGRYALVRKLGEGGQAATFEAVDKQAGSMVAIKRFRVRGAKSWKEVELAEREARVLASLSHPNLPRYVEHFEQGGELYLVTEKIEGENLLSLRKRGARFSVSDVLRLLHESAAVLDYLHSRAPPVIHRDIKPSNVLRRPDGSFALIDFGAVRDRLRPEGGSTVVGTFGYMAPEQFQGRAMPASDVYALGATALSMLTGSEPEDLPHKGLALDVATALQATAGASMIPLLSAMLEPNPDVRPSQLEPLLARVGPRSAAGAEQTPAQRSAPPSGTKPVAFASHRSDRSHTGRHRANRQQRWDEQQLERKLAKLEGRMSGTMITVVLIALAVARVAVALALGVAVPMVLTLLSIVFGKEMRQAAKRTSEAGLAAQNALNRASAHLWKQHDERRLRVTEMGEARGLRVQDLHPPRDSAKSQAGLDTEADREVQAEAEAEAASQAKAHRQRDKRWAVTAKAAKPK